MKKGWNKEIEDLIQDKIGYKFNNINLLYQAFTRRSYSEEFGGENNEILEFNGDSTLNYYVTKMMIKELSSMKQDSKNSDRNFVLSKFFIIQNIDEGNLSKLREEYNCNKNLSIQIDRLEFAKYMLMSKGDKNKKVYEEEKVKADLFEAIIGAVDEDSNSNQEILQEIIKKILNIQTFLKINIKQNEICVLNELYQKHILSNKPSYYFDQNVSFNGKKYEWACTIRISEWNINLRVFSDSKKQAKKYVAYWALCTHYKLHYEYEFTKN
ncbi:MAG: ribonuclease III family protein [Mycoplasmataceae bacterium]|nr:ribonuclease III family protein [Mycoplasmataceae bacterium]